MALDTICGTVRSGQELSCATVSSRYIQQMVLINFNDFAEKTIKANDTALTCERNISFELKEGKTGHRFTLSENGSSIFGSFDKSTNDMGYPQFLHRVNFATTGLSEDDKCRLEALSKGRFVVALQVGDTIEIYGASQGLVAGDFTYDPMNNSGFVTFSLESTETAQESHVPLVYKSAVPGQEIEDFDSNFENVA